ncbi:hypothetical protein [Undibacterium sp. TS12]|uniref:hypothetical protein n=1 Tax=Undibacterium sp. TS12 TaxID=2908202 RepID=UPI001F4C93FA|nr:hypothetical protein [Undibacterium sp. TS12]MCH8618709.1 hypothetical protein [Undibacterium sp. TS12]
MNQSNQNLTGSSQFVAILRWLILAATLFQGSAFAQPIQIAMKAEVTQPQRLGADCLPCPACYVITAPDKMKLIELSGSNLLFLIKEEEQLQITRLWNLRIQDWKGIALRLRFCCWRN